jgi:hypothetical protein
MHLSPNLICAAILTATAASATTVKLPSVTGVTFTPAGDGSYTATITGRNFGAIPTGIPCTACTPQQLALTDLLQPDSVETINVTAWSNKQITVTGIAANPGDPIRLAIWSAAAGNAAAWGGLVSPETSAPVINRIIASGSGATLKITVTGAGFGPAPAGVLGEVANSAFFVATDYSAAAANTGAGTSGDYPWNAGFCGADECDGVTLGYVKWTPTRIVVSGFGGSYGTSGFISAPGDAFCVGVWPSTSTSNGTTGGNVKCIRLP